MNPVDRERIYEAYGRQRAAKEYASKRRRNREVFGGRISEVAFGLLAVGALVLVLASVGLIEAVIR